MTLRLPKSPLKCLPLMKLFDICSYLYLFIFFIDSSVQRHVDGVTKHDPLSVETNEPTETTPISNVKTNQNPLEEIDVPFVPVNEKYPKERTA